MADSFLVVGQGGRESAFAQCLEGDSRVFAIMAHENPSIAQCVQNSGGAFAIGNPSDADFMLKFIKEHQINYAFINADGPLSDGVVDALEQGGAAAIGPSREGARLEWDKVYSMQVMHRLYPEFTPRYQVITHEKDIAEALEEFARDGLEVVVKPQGLTGGKGVKVMGEHLADNQEAEAYIRELLTGRESEQVLLVEKLQGMEFTIMGLTDGRDCAFAPATYDYPYRYDSDKGPGTGGMGCFTNNCNALPFMTDEHYQQCAQIMQGVVDDMTARDLLFNGVINGGFFLTPDGIRFMEFNARFGDPEGMNVLSVLQTPFSEVLKAFYHKTLGQLRLEFAPRASVVKYLVSPTYPGAGAAIDFELPADAYAEAGVQLYFSAARATGAGHYQTVSSSRVVALGCTAESIAEAGAHLNQCLEKYHSGVLEYRADIGTRTELDRLESLG